MTLNGIPLHLPVSSLFAPRRITRISPSLGRFLPNIEVLILTGNCMAHLRDLDSLSTLTKMKMLSLSGNPVTKLTDYRLYTIHRVPSLRVLDYQRVRPEERQNAAKKFSQAEQSSEQNKNNSNKAKTFDAEGEGKNGMALSWGTWFWFDSYICREVSPPSSPLFNRGAYQGSECAYGDRC